MTAEARELRAVVRGAKPMALIYIGRADVAELARDCARLGLVLVLAPPDERGDIAAYIARADQLWRVAAHQTLVAQPAYGRWSWHAEAIQSRLLGYSEQEIARYIARARAESIAPALTTLYAVLDRTRAAAVRATGQRGFPREVFPLHVLRVGRPSVPKRRLPRGVVLARFGVEPGFARGLRGSVVFAARDATRLSRALETNIELRSRGRWV